MSSTLQALQQLFQGTSPPNVNTGQQNLTQVPTWLLNSTNSLVSQANSVASQPYQQYSGPQVAPWTPDQLAAQGITQQLQGQYQPTLNAATNLATSSAGAANGAFNGAYGMLPAAQSTIQNSLAPSQAQMNPYINNVIKDAQNQTTQYWQNQIQPGIDAQFTANGNYGSAANQRAQNLSSNQLIQNLNSQSSSALAGAYQNAQNAGLAGGQALGNLSQIQGGLGYEQGSLGQTAASNLGNLATVGQNLGLQGAGTLYNVGAAQQAQGQNNLNTAYQNFQNQTYYPQNQLNWLSGIISGAPKSTGTATTNTSQAPLPGSSYGSSPFTTGLGIYTGLSGLGSTPTQTASP